jgi:hypothetical protein
MRVIVVLVVVGVSFALSGCSCPPQTGHSKAVRARCVSAQSQPKLTKASIAKPVTKPSRSVSKRSKKFKTRLAKPARPQIKAPASAETGPPLPPRKPELAPATDTESLPPLPPRKSEQTSDSREHAVPATKFMDAKEKAEREGVHSLTSEDVHGLSQEQIKELRGY